MSLITKAKGLNYTLQNSLIFYIENISSSTVDGCGIYLSGFKSNPLTKVYLSNISIEKATTDYCLQNGTDIVFDALKVNSAVLDKKPK